MNQARALLSLGLSIGIGLSFAPGLASAGGSDSSSTSDSREPRPLDFNARVSVVSAAVRKWNAEHPGAQKRIDKLGARAGRWEHMFLGNLAQATAVESGLRKPAQAWQNMVEARRGAAYDEKNALTTQRTAQVISNIERQGLKLSQVGRVDDIELDNYARALKSDKATRPTITQRARAMFGKR